MDAVTGWVHPLLKKWADVIRRPDSGFPPISMMGRIREQGMVGAAIRGESDGIPVRDIPRDVYLVNRIIKGMPYDMRIVVEARYLYRGSDKHKAQALHLTRHRYYTWLGKAQTWIAAVMAQHAQESSVYRKSANGQSVVYPE